MLAIVAFHLWPQQESPQARIIVTPDTWETPEEWVERSARSAKLAATLHLPLRNLEGIAYRYRPVIPVNTHGAIGKAVVDRITLGGLPDSQKIEVNADFTFVCGTWKGYELPNLRGSVRFNVLIKFGREWCPVLQFGESTVHIDAPTNPPALSSRAISCPIISGLLARPIGGILSTVAEWESMRAFIAEKVQSAVDDRLPALIDCKAITKSASGFWGSKSFKLFSIEEGPTLYANLDPHSFSVSDVKVSRERLSLTGMIVAGANILETARKPRSKPLPKINRLAQEPDDAQVAAIELNFSFPPDGVLPLSGGRPHE